MHKNVSNREAGHVTAADTAAILQPKSMKSTLILDDCIEAMKARADSAQLVLGSPPYPGKGERYIGGKKHKWIAGDWAEWMADVVEASLILAPVAMFVVNDAVKDGQYVPAVSMLEAACWGRGIVAERPLIWSKNAPPNRKDWWGNHYERIVAFKRESGSVPTWNWEAIAEPPLYDAGGDFRQRGSDGKRRQGGAYPTGKLTRPKDILRATVGGGHLGHKLAHENEAPYPEKLIEPIVLALTKAGDAVFDPFCGSGTTSAVAIKNGRTAVAVDCRESQIDLARRRIQDECGVESEVIGLTAPRSCA